MSRCIVCSKEILHEWRKDKQSIKTPSPFCSRSCCNTKVHAPETKSKISNSLKGIERPERRIPDTIFNCKICNQIIIHTSISKNKFCSKECRNLSLSVHRQEVLKKTGNFSTPREMFTYKHVTIEVDSNLEKAGIIYLLDYLNASRLERFHNIISYKEGKQTRTFNPDFICEIEGKTCISEVKQKWISSSNHNYNRNIPLKKKSLQEFCDNRGFKCLWLDFETTPILKKIYKQILKERI